MANKVAQANRAFSSEIQKVLSTITKSKWQVVNHPSRGALIRLYFLMPALTLKKQDGSRSYRLEAFIITQVIDSIKKNGSKTKKVTTREYIYKIASGQDGNSLYEFHWHPEKIDRATLEPRKLENGEDRPFPRPHAHVRGKDKRFDNLNKRHIPSGRVAFEDVIEFLLGDCGVKPQRADWKDVLETTRKTFNAERRW